MFTNRCTRGPVRAFVLSLCLLVVAPPANAEDAEALNSTVTLNGDVVQVNWSDGDSFRFLEGDYADHGVRLKGFNTLESYGPVHRWGEWTAAELSDVASQATDLARSARWSCTTEGETDNYDRVLVACDDLTLAMLQAGLAHLFVVGDWPPVEQIAAQREAQSAHLGMWAKGVPPAIVTSLHSADEGRDFTYNRVISTLDGSSSLVTHEDNYELCQEVCIRDSCLVYVPYDQRYGDDRAECLR